jgi:dTMP kinase
LQGNRSKAKLIVIEGPHGAGKTTLAKSLVTALLKIKVYAIYTKEPFSNDLKAIIRKYSSTRDVNPSALAFLIAADRSLHTGRIDQWLHRGAIVVTDRYYLSSYVYQRIDGVSRELIDVLNHQFRRADLTILLMAPLRLRIERSMERIHSKPTDRFSNQKSMKAEQRFYSMLTRSVDPRLRVFDGSRPMEDLVGDAVKQVSTIHDR